MTRYFFQRWQDGDMNVQKSFVVGSLDIDLVATYAAGYIMNITSTPISGVNFKIGTTPVQTPFNQVLQTGTYALTLTDVQVGNYVFLQWSDGDTNPGTVSNPKLVNLTADMTTPLQIIYQPLVTTGTIDIRCYEYSNPVSASHVQIKQGATLIREFFSTPQIGISLTEGDYTIIFSYGSYADLTQTIHVTVGQSNVNVSANFGAPFDFSISASPLSQPVTVGNATSFAVNTVLVAGQATSVTLSVSGLPSGVSSSFTQGVGNPPFSSTLNIQTITSTPTGSYSLTISGVGGGLTRTAMVTLQVNSVQVQRGTIQVTVLIGNAVVTNASGDIKDPNGNIVDTFTATPHSWDQAIVGVQYMVTCHLTGYADQVGTAMVTTEGGSVSQLFQFGEAGTLLWALAAGGIGIAVVVVYLATRKKKGKS